MTLQKPSQEALQVTILREDGERSGRYVAKIEGAAGEGELAYYRRAPDVVIANHTGVPPALQGRGIAAKLVERLIADANAEGFRIAPACSYVAAQRKRHPEWEKFFVS